MHIYIHFLQDGEEDDKSLCKATWERALFWFSSKSQSVLCSGDIPNNLVCARLQISACNEALVETEKTEGAN